MIDRIRKKPIEVQRITLKNLQYNPLALLLENVLFSMVKFDEPEVREEGIKRIWPLGTLISIHTKLVEVLVPIY